VTAQLAAPQEGLSSVNKCVSKVVGEARYYHSIRLEGRKRIKKKLNQGRRRPGLNSNRERLK
jgi:hypothetical protein